MYCDKCGKQLKGKEKFCPKCGNAIHPKSPSEKAQGKKQTESKGRKGLFLKVTIAITGIIALILICISVLKNIERKSVKIAADEAAAVFSNGDVEEINRLVFGIEKTELNEKIRGLLEESDDENSQEGIIADLFSRSTVSVNKVGIDTIEFEILSPDMEKVFQNLPGDCTELSETDLAEYINEYADKAEYKEYVVSVYYEKEGSEVVINFQNEKFINAVTGGMIDSYKQLYADAIEEYQEGGVQ